MRIASFVLIAALAAAAAGYQVWRRTPLSPCPAHPPVSVPACAPVTSAADENGNSLEPIATAELPAAVTKTLDASYAGHEEVHAWRVAGDAAAFRVSFTRETRECYNAATDGGCAKAMRLVRRTCVVVLDATGKVTEERQVETPSPVIHAR